MKYFTLIAGIPIVLAGMSIILSGGESGPAWVLIIAGAFVFLLGQMVVRFQDFPFVDRFFRSIWETVDKRLSHFSSQSSKTISSPSEKLA